MKAVLVYTHHDIFLNLPKYSLLQGLCFSRLVFIVCVGLSSFHWISYELYKKLRARAQMQSLLLQFLLGGRKTPLLPKRT